MAKKKNPLVFLDVSVDGGPTEKIRIEVTYYFLQMLFLKPQRISEHSAQVSFWVSFSDAIKFQYFQYWVLLGILCP
ncbi:hypothetical protein GIB67_008569 [Kingdonia uniflora]|uniref:Uncharacterized protein n=1 Tax=Kingdonia uniflora TaxID=39325 RepID=A0A7J7N4H8_9MAGN|nr:hypothetical protein GIB67_008569 [Kingdonia uniflora]